MNRKKSSAAVKGLLIEALESRQLLSASASEIVLPSLSLSPAASSSGTIEGFTPAQIRAAYGINAVKLDGVTGTGAGETIAIVDAYSDPNIAADLAVFDKEFDLAAPSSFTQESASGSTTKLPAENADWDAEISLDVEWAHAIAPKANIVLVDASSDSMSGLMAAVEYARTIKTVSVISMSWGGSEFSGETSYDKYFTTPTGHINITFVAASGDDGAAGGADYPASSPNVVSVGGTTLELTATDTVESESAWTDSEGGVSAFESTPSYQSAAGITSSGRSTPDVSYDANPDTGVAVYDSVSDDGYVGWQEVGGTSAGTPQWAALIAIADQGRARNGLATLSTTQTLDELYSIYSNPTDYAADFSDITSGSSVVSQGGGFGGPFGGGPFGGRFGRGRGAVEVSATTGYDTLTGLGTPKATALEDALSTASVTAASVVKTTTTTATTTKTSKAKARAAIEMEEVASVFGFRTSGLSLLSHAPVPPTTVEIETAAATTTAAAIAEPESTVAAVTDFHSEVSPLETPARSAACDPGLLASEETNGSASAVAAKMSETSRELYLAASTTLQGIFNDTVIAREFREGLAEATESSAALSNGRPRSSAPSLVFVAAALAADAALIGYVYAKRKCTSNAADIFNSQTPI
jgi:hypothetical protein